MLIGGDDISNDVITLGTFFSMFVYIRARLLFALIDRNLTGQSSGSHGEIGGGIEIPKTSLQALLPLPAPPPEHTGQLSRKSTPDSFLARAHQRAFSQEHTGELSRKSTPESFLARAHRRAFSQATF